MKKMGTYGTKRYTRERKGHILDVKAHVGTIRARVGTKIAHMETKRAQTFKPSVPPSNEKVQTEERLKKGKTKRVKKT